MRLVSLEQFIQLPSGIWFMPYRRGEFSGFSIKGESCKPTVHNHCRSYYESNIYGWLESVDKEQLECDLEVAEFEQSRIGLDLELNNSGATYPVTNLLAVLETEDLVALNGKMMEAIAINPTAELLKIIGGVDHPTE